MAENSKIEWTTHTFNPWRGCTKISPGCTNCYAETLSGRNPGTLGVWGPKGTRVVASETMWREPLKWNKAAAYQPFICKNCDTRYFCESGSSFRCKWKCEIIPYRPRVFCASLADVFEDWHGPIVDSKGRALHLAPSGAWCPEGLGSPVGDTGWRPLTMADRPLTMADVRARLFALIDATPHLDWLLLTKRPENIAQIVPGGYWIKMPCPEHAERFHLECPACNSKNATRVDKTRPNVWLGTSVENRATTPRIDILRTIPAAVRFLSIEPLLEDVGQLNLTGISWVIVGGESGPSARPCRIEWIRSIVEQCKAASVPVFCKQLGSMFLGEEFCRFESESEWVCKARSWLGGISGGGTKYKQPEKARCFDSLGRWCQIGRDFMQATKDGAYPVIAYSPLLLSDRKGGDIEEWPQDLRVRQFPEVPA